MYVDFGILDFRRARVGLDFYWTVALMLECRLSMM